MKRYLVPLALAAALLLPAQASAKTKRYAGSVTPSGSVHFKVVQKAHKKTKRVTGFSFGAVPVNCADGPHTTSGLIGFSVKLHKNGTFAFSAVSSVTGATVAVQGKLSAGTIHVAGNVPLDGGGSGQSCDSGVLNWTAARA